MKLIRTATFSLLILTFMISSLLYPALPDMIATHWNASGEVDGYMSKFWGVFFIPLLMLGFTALLMYLPRIDPKRENYREFQDYYDGFILILALFFFVIQVQMLLFALGTEISPSLTFPVIIGLLFVYIGIMIGKTRQNWFVGIRTPWTLSSERVWNKTHERGSLVFKVAGIVCIGAVMVPGYAIWIVLLTAILAVVYTVVYSYLEYQKEIAGE